MAEHVIYVYGIVTAGLDASGAPSGVDAAPVELRTAGDVAALVSRLDADVYAGDGMDARLADVAWVAPRAMAHDAVLSWASDAGAVVPLPMFTLFRDERGVDAMLAERATELRATLERVAPAQEFGVRVFRIDTELARHVAELSPAIATLEQSARQAGPGQRYLLERKAEGERAAEVRRVAADVAREVYDALQGQALADVRDAIPAPETTKGAGTAILNAYFLVRRDALDPFRAVLTSLAKRYEPLGFRFDFTGPWAPYHFAGGST